MADRHHRETPPARRRSWLRVVSDELLVSHVRRGETIAFEILYDRYARGLMAFCQQMLGSRQDAEDALQSTFAAAYRSLCADERDVALRPWL